MQEKLSSPKCPENKQSKVQATLHSKQTLIDSVADISEDLLHKSILLHRINKFHVNNLPSNTIFEVEANQKRQQQNVTQRLETRHMSSLACLFGHVLQSICLKILFTESKNLFTN